MAKYLTGLVRFSTRWQSKWRRANTRLLVSQSLIQQDLVNTPRGRVTFQSGHPQQLEYSAALLTRETDTISWIESFDTPCVFWDIGANIGAYSIYAALDTEVTVYSFEPASATYAALCENIRINNMDSRVSAFCIALSDITKAGSLNMAHTNAASVSHAFENFTTHGGEKINSVFRQSVLGFSIDDFQSRFDIPLPNYLKIDVDSIEIKILEGAKKTLGHSRLKSILIEAGTETEKKSIRAVMDKINFKEISPPEMENMIFFGPNQG